MKNFIPTLICLVVLFFAALKDNTFNVAPPMSWFDVAGMFAVAGLVATFIWGLVQQSNDNDTRRASELRQRAQESFPSPRAGAVPKKPTTLASPKRESD